MWKKKHFKNLNVNLSCVRQDEVLIYLFEDQRMMIVTENIVQVAKIIIPGGSEISHKAVRVINFLHQR